MALEGVCGDLHGARPRRRRRPRRGGSSGGGEDPPRPSAERVPPQHRALHRAQAGVYAALLAAHALPRVTVRVRYLDVDSQRETAFDETLDAPELRARLEGAVRRFAAWAADEGAHRAARDRRAGRAGLAARALPRRPARAGRPRSTAPRRLGPAACWRRRRPASARRWATLFPVLKALPCRGIDKRLLRRREDARDGAWRWTPWTRCAGARRPAAAGAANWWPSDKACAAPRPRLPRRRLPAGRAASTTGCRAAREAAAPRWLAGRRRRCASRRLRRTGLPLLPGARSWRAGPTCVVGDYNYLFDSGALLPALVQDERLARGGAGRRGAQPGRPGHARCTRRRSTAPRCARRRRPRRQR
ncbi:MAG: hypothetical protein MZW92_28445 [Comamonadaceae bacterium]|nr:hypothetical protein [Comamonadaceae bacterium]